MSYEQISALLEKYWEGESTLEEERVLKAYFTSGRVDEQFRLVAPLFQALKSEQSVEYTKPQIVDMRPQQYQWRTWAVAASIAVLLFAGSWWYFSSSSGLQDVAQQPVVQPKSEAPVRLSPAPEVQQPVPAPQVEAPTAPLANIEKPRLNAKPRHKWIKKHRTPPGQPDSFEDPEQAYEEIKAALALVSSKLNRGKTEAVKNVNKIETIDRFFKKKKETQG